MYYIHYHEFGKRTELPIAEVKEVKRRYTIFGVELTISYSNYPKTVRVRGNKDFVNTVEKMAYAISNAYYVGKFEGIYNKYS